MSIETAIEEYLNSKTGITDQFGTRFFADRLPARGSDGLALAWPRLTYQRISGVHQHHLGGIGSGSATLDPNATTSSNWAADGSGGAHHLKLSDDSDLTYLQASDNTSTGTFTYGDLPATAATVSAVNIRTRLGSGPASSGDHECKIELFTGAGLISQGSVTLLNTGGIFPAWYAASLSSLSISKADFELGHIILDSSPYDGIGDFRVMEVELVPTYTTRVSFASGMVMSRFQFDVWAEDNEQRAVSAEAVRNALDGFIGSVDSVSIDHLSLDNESDTYEDPQHGQERGVYRRRMDFVIWYRVGIPTLA